MASVVDRLAAELAEAARGELRRERRTLDSPQGARVREGGRTLVSFAANDYLGLANHARLREAARRAIEEYGVGAGASPLVTGHLGIHEEAERRFATFVGLPRALLFGSGYAANLGILPSLAGRTGEVFADRLNHACLNDGAVLSRARFTRYAHGDVDALARRLAASRAAVRVVATDAVFSMDGDLAPLGAILALCERHDAWLVVDDAHGMGVLGARGRGALEHFALRSPRIVYMATLGKALGGYGAFVAGEDAVVEWLLQRARTYVFSTALPPVAAAAAMAAMAILESDDSPVRRLRSRIEAFQAACRAQGLATPASSTAIQPVIVGSAARAVEISARLRERGYLVPAIRPPTVPEGTSRLRISLSAAHEPGEIEGLVRALAESLDP